MADAASPKRVLPARERRESAAKRRASSPIPPPKPATPKKSTPAKSSPKTAPTQRHATKKGPVEPSPLRRPSTPIIEETLPTKITEAKPLPTSRQPQPLHLSTAEYRSVAESAVLAASLHRSRVKWLCDGVFEKYWTKPSKKKGAPEVSPNNPDQKSMQRLGNCTVTIEPHTFDAVIYIVRDPNGPPPVYYRHPNQYPQPPPPQHLQNHYPGGPLPPPPPPPPPPNLQAKPQQPPPPSPSPGIKQEPGAAGSQPPPAATVSTAQPTGPPPRPPSSGNSAQPSQSPPASTPAPQKGNTDPVIQMLATRAAADPALKELMKVVASSKASQDQLKQFQGHIDELNEIIRRQQAEKEQREGDSRQQSHLAATTPTPTQLDGASNGRPTSGTNTSIQAPGPNTAPQPPPYPPASHPGSGHRPPPIAAPGLAGKVGPFGPPHPPPYPHYALPPPRPEPRIKHIVVEFTTAASGTQAASQDRWLFPEYAVLDTPISGRGLEMVCSFFVIRKGSQILATAQQDTTDSEATTSGKWKPDEEYYQAVTMTLKAPAHRTLETIARAAKPLPEVQAFMRKVIEEKKRAPVEYLVTRLPREKDKVVETDGALKDGWEFVDSGVEVTSAEEDDDLKEFYGI
jgi:hypothetical protein